MQPIENGIMNFLWNKVKGMFSGIVTNVIPIIGAIVALILGVLFFFMKSNKKESILQTQD